MLAILTLTLSGCLEGQVGSKQPTAPIKPLTITVTSRDGWATTNTIVASTSLRLENFLKAGEAEIPLYATKPFLLRGKEKVLVEDGPKQYTGHVVLRKPGSNILCITNFCRSKNSTRSG